MEMTDFALYTYPAPKPAESKYNLLFAHANGVPALTYKTFFQLLTHEMNINIVSYDMRGIGKTRIKENIKQKEWSWQTLVDDHFFIFKHLQTHMQGEWILSGHSLGAWLSLLSAEKLHIQKVWLFDPPILFPNIVLKWMFAILINKKYLSPNSKKVRKRKVRYPSYDEAYAQLKMSSFMKNWGKEVIYNYLEGSFSQESGYIQLRHNPEWEAHLFEEYPPAAFLGFLRLSCSFRRQFQPIFFVGEKSDTCNPKSKSWVKVFFPMLRWISIQNGGHMFPIELPHQTIKQISELI